MSLARGLWRKRKVYGAIIRSGGQITFLEERNNLGHFPCRRKCVNGYRIIKNMANYQKEFILDKMNILWLMLSLLTALEVINITLFLISRIVRGRQKRKIILRCSLDSSSAWDSISTSFEAQEGRDLLILNDSRNFRTLSGFHQQIYEYVGAEHSYLSCIYGFCCLFEP